MVTDWSKIYKKYKGEWVALSSDETTVLGAGKTLKEAVKQAKRKSDKIFMVTRMPQSLATYVGSI